MGTLVAVANLIMTLLLIVIVVLVARRVSAMRADTSGAKQGWATAESTADVSGDVGALCRRALQEVAGASTSERFDRSVTFVAAPGANVGFTLTPLGEGRTRVAITVAGTFSQSELHVGHGRERATLAAALATWLTEHGNAAPRSSHLKA